MQPGTKLDHYEITARGTHVDHRADIWAFGVVLFGMLTGGRRLICNMNTDHCLRL